MCERDTVSRGSTHKHTLHHTHTHTHSDSYSLFLCVSYTQRCKRARECVCMRGHVGVSSRTCKRATVSMFLFCLSLSNPLPLSYLGEVGLYEGDVGEKLCESEGDGETKKSVQRGTDRPKRECVYVCLPAEYHERVYTSTQCITRTHTLTWARVRFLCVPHTHMYTHAHTHTRQQSSSCLKLSLLAP